MAERMVVTKSVGMFRWRGPAVAAEGRPGDLALACGMWLLLLAQFLTILPASATGIFLPAMANDLGRGVALLGALRSLGGVAALACGILVAPLIDRAPRAWTIAGGLLLLALASFLATQASLASFALFCLLFGAAGAIYQPALQSAAADGRDAATGARAAALLTGCGALAPMLAGPLLAATAGRVGWRGDFLAMAALTLPVIVLAAARLDRRPPTGVARPGYRAAFRLVAAAPGALPLLLGSTLRATLQWGWITYLAAHLVARFGATSGAVALTWGMGGTCVFLANLAVGRLIAGARPGSWRTPERLLPAILVAQVVVVPLGLLVPSLPLAMVVAALTAGTHGAAIAAVISLLVGRYAPLRGAVLGLNAAGFNLGTFAGAALGGVALGLGGYHGLALALSALAAATAVATAWALRPVAPSINAVEQSPR
jgi:MFS transporter, DHA1 family, inner membrane transport protein